MRPKKWRSASVRIVKETAGPGLFICTVYDINRQPIVKCRWHLFLEYFTIIANESIRPFQRFSPDRRRMCVCPLPDEGQTFYLFSALLKSAPLIFSGGKRKESITMA